MSLKTDKNGMFIFGMTSTDELGGFLKHKFSEHQIQQAYDYLVEATKEKARSEKNITASHILETPEKRL